MEKDEQLKRALSVRNVQALIDGHAHMQKQQEQLTEQMKNLNHTVTMLREKVSQLEQRFNLTLANRSGPTA